MTTIRATLTYDIDYNPDFTDLFLDYLETKNILDYFWVSNMNTFTSEDEVYSSYAKMIESFKDNPDVLDIISDMILFANDLDNDERLIEQVRKSIKKPYRNWIATVDFTELAKTAMNGRDVRPLIQGMTKRRRLLKFHRKINAKNTFNGVKT